MNKIVTGLTLSLTALPAFAAAVEEGATFVQQGPADPTGLIVFALVFIGLVGYYGYVIWKSGRTDKETSE
jgi:hypothetical protein